MDDARSEHPDEGTIHAWLDGALDDAAAQSVAAHVADCRACAPRVAEARGLIAGASRVVRALDDDPSVSGPEWGRTSPPMAPPRPMGASASKRAFRVTPARAAIAATVLVALGVSLTYRRTAVDSDASRAPGAASAMSSRVAAPTASAERDPLLDSAVARNLAIAQPPRALRPADGPALPTPEPAPAGAAMSDAAASTRVAAGRAAVQAQRDSSAGTAPDQLPGTAAASANKAMAEQMVASRRADSAGAPTAGVMIGAPARGVARARVGAFAPQPVCYRVESANGAVAAWGPVALPFVMAVDSATRGVRVLSPAGQTADASATVSRADGDSLLVRLRRIGYEGTLALGAPGEARAGVMRSRPLQVQLESAVITATGGDERRSALRTAASAKTRASVPAAAPAPAPEIGTPAVPVVARRTACPTTE